MIAHKRADGIWFEVTGVDVRGRRFKQRYDSRYWAMCVNLWRGSVWLCQDGQPRKLIKRVYN